MTLGSVCMGGDMMSDDLDTVSRVMEAGSTNGHVQAELDRVLRAIDAARETVEAATVALRDSGADKLVVEAVSYAHAELLAAHKRLIQRTVHLAAPRQERLIA